jgi:UDP-N-acetylmuramoyl-L-alanyl-D-glutamate--2,6-diaminopimelate ligase
MVGPYVDPIDLRVVVDGNAPAVEITGISIASTDVQPGDVFVAMPGVTHHGASFATDAVSRGASAVITDHQGADIIGEIDVPIIIRNDLRENVGHWSSRIYRTGEHALRIIGVTGTNGKTTVAQLVRSGCEAAGLRVAVIGTLGIESDGVTIPTGRTTPEAPVLHRWLATFEQQGIDIVVVEVSSHAMSEHRVTGVVFDIAAFTHLSQDHLDYHGTMEAYFAAKSELFTATFARQAVIGIDDEWGLRLAESCVIPATTWSCHRGDVTGKAISGGLRIALPGGDVVDMPMPLPGAFNIENATCSAAILEIIGISPRIYPHAFADVRIPGRMEAIHRHDGVAVIVDYAHTPDAIDRVIGSIERTGRVIVIIGAGGDRDQGKRRGMGVAAGQQSDVVIVTDDNPRSEDPRAIRSEVMAGVQTTSAELIEIGDRRAAIAQALSLAVGGDTVLVLGKGHEGGQEVNGVVSPFDDRAVVRDLLGGD